MSHAWETYLERWTGAGLIDASAAEQIRNWESHHSRSQGFRWPILLALACGGILLGAGILLFVAAHWDQLSPAQRLTLVLMMVGGFHLGGAALQERFSGLATTLHTLGTIALGGGIALTGQIFHLSGRWPAAIMLWALGAVLAWLVLNHWTQATLAAMLVPAWLVGEWMYRSEFLVYHRNLPVETGLIALALTYLSARRGQDDNPFRKALAWLGGLSLLPLIIGISIDHARPGIPSTATTVAWVVALGFPLAVAVLLRGAGAVYNGIAILWTVGLAVIRLNSQSDLPLYAWCAIGAIGLAAWGIGEARTERINLGIAGFALTVLFFYFSHVLDKLDRSASLLGLGVLFLAGGWLLERTRRDLVARIQPEAI